MTRYVLDTNHLSEAIRKVSRLRDRIRASLKSGNRFGTCISTICELEAGIQQTTRATLARHRLEVVLEEVRIWPIDRKIAEVFGSLYVTLAKRGRSLSFVDITVAAWALAMNGVVLTTDHDFEALPEVPTENWLS